MSISRTVAFILIIFLISTAITIIAFNSSSFLNNGYVPSTENLNNIASAIQSIVISVTLITGGIWSWMKATELMEYKLAKIRAEQEFIDLKRRPNLDVKLVITELSATDKKERYIVGNANLKNTGNSPAFIMFNTPVKAVKIAHGENNIPYGAEFFKVNLPAIPDINNIGSKENLNLIKVDNTIIDSQCDSTICFSIKVDSPGLYLVQITIPIDEKRSSVLAEEYGPTNVSSRIYAAQNYIYIDE